MKKTKAILFYLFIVLASVSASGFELPVTIFPLDNYNQNLEHWIRPSDCDYDQPLISTDRQKVLCQEFYNHYYASEKDSLLRLNESVQQVWIAPYEDASGIYHDGSSIYMVAKKGQWTGKPPLAIIEDDEA